jgi:hypothetical protein
LFALIYVPFVFAILMQSLVSGEAVDPAEWEEKLGRK